MCIELKIKSKHLSAESQIIRFEERKLKERIKHTKSIDKIDQLREKWVSVNQHRRMEVRNENRSTFLARAYLAGKSYATVEQKRKPERESIFQSTILNRTLTMVLKYGTVAQRRGENAVTIATLREWSKM